jgi:heme-degrading monooxygenase HmoA
MSVMVTLWVKGDPKRLEEFASGNREAMQSIRESAEQHGLIAHRFYGTDDGQIMVTDEWPDAQSFQAFFGETREQIEPLMQAAGAQGEPGINFWRKLDTHDEVGWGA